MAAAKGPVAIRITRPYQTEEQFLAHELETISRTGVMLVGAQQRQEGTVLRFEIALASGAPLLRGEGRVIGFKEAAHGDEPGLSLRFTRLDSKSKALVDKVGSMRDAKRSIPPEVKRSVPPPPPPPSSPSARPPSVRPPSVAPPPPRPPSVRPRGVPPPLPPAARRSAAPPPPPPPSSSAEKVPVVAESIPELLTTSDVVAVAAEPAPVAAPEPVTAPTAALPDRASALERLRKRPLDPDRVAQILSEGAARRR